MGVFAKIEKDINDGKQIMIPKCPICGETLKVVMHGYPDKKFVEFLDKHNVPYKLAGCICFCDDRDEVYRCGACHSRRRRMRLLSAAKLKGAGACLRYIYLSVRRSVNHV